MKKPYYLTVIFAIVIIILLALLVWPKSSDESAAIQACLENGGSFDFNAQTCSPETAPTSPTSPTASKPKPASSGIIYTPASAASMVKVASPVVNATLHPTAPVSIAGEAVGPWFFEGTFPIQLVKADGTTIISYGVARAVSDWATSSFVGFTGTLGYNPQPENSKGYIILKRDNPSGLPQNDASVMIPVIFQ